MKFTSISSSNLSLRQSTEPLDISTRWRQQCLFSKSSYISINSSDHLLTFIHKAYATETSNHRICYLIHQQEFSSCVISEVQRYLSNQNQMCHTFVRDIIVLQNWFLVPQTTQQRLVRIVERVCWNGLTFSRRLVNRLCHGWIDAWATSFPWRVGYRPTRWNHQGLGHTNKRSNSNHESKLYGTQIPSNQTTSFQQSVQKSITRSNRIDWSFAWIYTNTKIVSNRSHVSAFLWRTARSVVETSRFSTCWGSFKRTSTSLQLHSPW